MATVISGILAFPRLSRNGVFYWPQELAKFNDASIPLRFNHIKTPDGVVGDAKLSFNEDTMQVTYIARITDPVVQKLVDNHNFQVSLGANTTVTTLFIDSVMPIVSFITLTNPVA